MTLMRTLAACRVVGGVALLCVATIASEAVAQQGAQSKAAGGSWGWLPLPKVTMPKVEMPSMQTVTAPFKASYRKVTDGSKKAWEGTKELFQMGTGGASEPTERVASREQPSLWQRMFGGAPEEDQGPQTIGEFMQGSRPQ